MVTDCAMLVTPDLTCRNFERSELIGLRERAWLLAVGEGLNPHWKRAYLALADAADHLDAMIARTIIPGASLTVENGSQAESA